VVAAIQPEGAIVVNEAATSGLGWAIGAAGAPPHEAFSLTGGAIGQGLPCAVGAAVAAPDRKVIALQADGSGLYTLQSLWTMAREGLDVTVVVCANRAYRILQMELHRTGNEDPGPQARSLTDLGSPVLDWVSLAEGFGVEGMQATTVEELRAGLERGLATEGPYLVEALI
jgi:acetolactate synthase-1/2/3 large subunit